MSAGNPITSVELLAPAGNFEKLGIAVHFGADAVYLSGKQFSLRNFSGNFETADLGAAIDYAHQHRVKVYVACNVFARNADLQAIEAYLTALETLRPDGLIISDPGVWEMARVIMPGMPLHLSTQANTTNLGAVKFWQTQGARRVNVARELSLDEISEISQACPELEIEAFVHGAMCISYSGRCLLSAYLTDRDSNSGKCSHPCRWRYAVVEEFRPGKYMPVLEDDQGTYIFNSKDLCMLEHLPEMIAAGVATLKIEGRMKGIHYLASTVKVYREALDAYLANPYGFKVRQCWRDEIQRVSHRGYCTGFYFGRPDQTAPNLANRRPRTDFRFAGKIIENIGGGRAVVEVRNKLTREDAVEILCRKGPPKADRIQALYDLDGKALTVSQPGSRVVMAIAHDVQHNDLIRKRIAC